MTHPQTPRATKGADKMISFGEITIRIGKWQKTWHGKESRKEQDGE